MADRRTISEYYTELAKQVIDEEERLEHLRINDITIVYLESSHAKKSKGMKVCGQCEKVQEKNKWGIPADFTITIFAPNVMGMTEEQLKILLFHELLHIGMDHDSVTAHDLSDFKYIIDRFGVDWAEVKEPGEKAE